jgi:di/tripeptidase
MFGPAGEGAHAAEEWVDVASAEAVARTLLEVAARVCA